MLSGMLGGRNCQRIVIAGCEFNALGSTAVRGVSLVDSPDIYVEGCSFVNFPKDGMFESSAIHYESTSENLGGRPGITRLGVVNTLFDNSFTNAYVLAPLVSGMGYEVSMSSSVIPSVPEYEAHSTSNVIVGNVSVNSRGYLLPGSIGIGQGVSPIYSTIDVNGVTRGGVVDIGAARYIDPSSNQDTDQDGIRDWDEIEDGTDPTLADTDGDNIDDGVESSEGTNPSSKLDYCFSADITIENPEREDTPASVVLFASGSATEPVSAVVYATNDVNSLLIPHRRALGETPYKIVAWHDSNENGILDDETVFDEWSFSPNAHAAARTVRLPSRDDDSDGDGLSDWHEVVAHGTNRRKADSDGDGIPDGVEVGEATDPLNPSNYCFAVHIVVTNRVVGSGALCWAVASSNECGVVFLTTPMQFQGTASEEFDIPDQVVTNGEPRYLVYWHDHNGNNLFDPGSELYMITRLDVKNHDNQKRLAIDSKVYDRDGDGMPDWWELESGLDPYSDDAIVDSDNDGYVNIHEYWMESSPTNSASYLSGTALAAACQGVDQRLNQHSLGPFGQCLFNRYSSFSDLAAYGYNTECWLYGLDVSGMSHWNSWISKWQAGTAITRRHVLFARHYMYSETGRVYFTDMNGTSYGIKIAETNALANTDFTVAILESDIPPQISVVKMLPTDYRRYIGERIGLPIVTFNQREQASVSDWSCRTLNGSSCKEPVSLLRRNEYISLVSGDSGDPAFLIIDNEPILVHTIWHGDAGSGPFVTYYAEDIQDVCDLLTVRHGLDPADYKIRFKDLSEYTPLPRFQGDHDD